MINSKVSTLLVILIIGVLLYIPYIGEILRTYNTMIHESGHAITTTILGGEVKEIELYKNTEGVTQSASDMKIKLIATSFAGYIFSSLFLLISAFLYKKEKHKILFSIISIISLINMIFWIRNLYGIVWIISFVAILGFILYKKRNWIKNVMLSLIMVLAVDSTRAVIDILILSWKTPNEAGDAKGLSEMLLLPPIVWGIFFVIQHLIFLLLALKFVSRKR